MLLLRPKPEPYQVSKFQKTAALLEVAEFEELFSRLDRPLFFYHIGAVLPKVEVSLQELCALYRTYLEAIKEGKRLPSFAIAMTEDPTTLYAIAVEGGGFIAKLLEPTIQITPHALCYVPELHTFKEKLYGKDLIPWGVQLIYPQLFQDAKTHAIHNALLEYKNGSLFREVQRVMRDLAKPTTFITKEGELKTALRLGPGCRSWIQDHLQLKEAGIEVMVTRN